MGKTSIEWTDASWNPIVGCTEVSPGCANCYAARLAATRLKNHPDYKGLAVRARSEIDDAGKPTLRSDKFLPRWTGEVRFLPERLEEPLHWKKPRRIFVCDMGDLFHEAVHDEWLSEIISVILNCPQHTFQILTKRPARMAKWFEYVGYCASRGNAHFKEFPLPNVWLGVSVENQHFADERIPLLLSTPAAVRWISAEPLLGEIYTGTWLACMEGVDPYEWQGGKPVKWRALRPKPRIDWVVCGGESGPGARPMHPDWARSLRDQCQSAGVPFFFKQWGQWQPITYVGKDTKKALLKISVPQPDGIRKSTKEIVFNAGSPDSGVNMLRVGKKKAGRLLDGREWSEFPR